MACGGCWHCLYAQDAAGCDKCGHEVGLSVGLLVSDLLHLQADLLRQGATCISSSSVAAVAQHPARRVAAPGVAVLKQAWVYV